MSNLTNFPQKNIAKKAPSVNIDVLIQQRPPVILLFIVSVLLVFIPNINIPYTDRLHQVFSKKQTKCKVRNCAKNMPGYSERTLANADVLMKHIQKCTQKRTAKPMKTPLAFSCTMQFLFCFLKKQYTLLRSITRYCVIRA